MPKKTVNGIELPRSAFLVADDPNEVGTWHLPVKGADGKPDHRLMGAAHAALTKGYRGNKYEGPGKEQAIKKLKSLYKQEGMDWPEDSSEAAEAEPVKESGAEAQYIPMNVFSFAQLEAAEQASELVEDAMELTEQFNGLLCNIVWSQEMPNKIPAIQGLFDEYVQRLQSLWPPEEMAAEETAQAVTSLEPVAEAQPLQESLQESFSSPVAIIEDLAEKSESTLLRLNTVIIQPGWGNEADNHFYPAEMLKRDATRFAGAKMYETDHRDEEKSTRTWVSTIEEIQGFTDDGAPIARVVVHDPGFAERLRNLNEANLLKKMECSIMALGRAVPGFELGGRKGKRVDEITEVSSVDWVTRAGAGGHALNLAESADGAGKTEVENTTMETDAAVTPIEPETTQETEVIQPSESLPVSLERAAVVELLNETNLPEISKNRLLTGRYESAEEVQEVIKAEIAYIKELTGSGKVTSLGAGSQPVNSPLSVSMEEINRRKDAVNQKYIGRRS